MEFMEDISEDMEEFMRQRNSFQYLLESHDMLTEEECALLAQKLVSFENCHITANRLFNRNPLFARALRNELDIYVKGM